MGRWIKRAYEETLKKLMELAKNATATTAKLIYREASEVTEAVDGDQGEFSTIRGQIIRRLISIYRAEGNLPVVESMLKKLSQLRFQGRPIILRIWRNASRPPLQRWADYLMTSSSGSSPHSTLTRARRSRQFTELCTEATTR